MLNKLRIKWVELNQKTDLDPNSLTLILIHIPIGIFSGIKYQLSIKPLPKKSIYNVILNTGMCYKTFYKIFVWDNIKG